MVTSNGSPSQPSIRKKQKHVYCSHNLKFQARCQFLMKLNVQMRPQLFSLYLPELLLFSLCLIVFSPHKAGFLHAMAAGHPQWTPFKLPQALAIMTVGQGKGVVGWRKVELFPFVKKSKAFSEATELTSPQVILTKTGSHGCP